MRSGPFIKPEKSWLAKTRCMFAGAILVCISTSDTIAEEIHVLAAVAVQDPLDRLIAAFTQTTGNKVDIRYALTGPILADVKAGRLVDVVVLPDAGRVRLEEAGLSASQTPVSVSLVGVGVPISAVSPDISSLEKFTALLHQVPSISYTDPKSGGAFGQSFDRTLVKLGLAEEVRRKALLVRGSKEIVDAVSHGDAALAISFKSAIVTMPSLKFAGALPPPFDSKEPFTAIELKSAASSELARAFIANLVTPAAQAIWNERGFVPAAEENN